MSTNSGSLWVRSEEIYRHIFALFYEQSIIHETK